MQLASGRRGGEAETRFVAVSATIPNLGDIREWLSGEDRPGTDRAALQLEYEFRCSVVPFPSEIVVQVWRGVSSGQA